MAPEDSYFIWGMGAGVLFASFSLIPIGEVLGFFTLAAVGLAIGGVGMYLSRKRASSEGGDNG